MNYGLLLKHFQENQRVAFLVPNATVKRLLIKDLLNSQEKGGLSGNRIFSFNDFILESPLSPIEDAFAADMAISGVLTSSAFKNVSFYEFVQRTLKILISADLDIATLEKAGCSSLLINLYRTYQLELEKSGKTKMQIFKKGISSFDQLKSKFFGEIDEVIAIGVGATHYLEKQFIVELQKRGIIFYDFTDSLLEEAAQEVKTKVVQNRIEEVKKIYQLAKYHHTSNNDLNQVFIFKNLYRYKDLLKNYFPASFRFHPGLDLMRTPLCTFLFSFLGRLGTNSSSYIHPLVTHDVLAESWQGVPQDATFKEYFSRLKGLLEKMKLAFQVYQTSQPLFLRRDLKVLHFLLTLIEEVNALPQSEKQVSYDHFLSFLELLFSHQSYSENRRNEAAFPAYEFRNITFWRGDILYLVGFHQEDRSSENPLLPEKKIHRINEICGEKRLLDQTERLAQEERIVLSNLKLGNSQIYILRPHAGEGKIYFWPQYIEKLAKTELPDVPITFFPDRKAAYIQTPYTLPLLKKLYEDNPKTFRELRHKIATLQSLDCVEEIGHVRAQSKIQAQFTKMFSPSQLESYGKCGYRFFLESVLGLRQEDEDEYELTPLEKGSVYHTSLFRFYQLRKKRGKTKIDEKDLHEAKNQIQWAVDSAFTDYQRPLFWKLDRDRIFQLLLQFCEKEALDDWIPSYFEASFRYPTGVLDFFGDEIILRGIIDRIDVKEDKFLVIDYKTGSTLPPLSGIERGENFQLPVYRLAAEHCFNQIGKEGEATFYQLGSLEKKMKLTQKKYQALSKTVLDYIKKEVSLIKKAQFYRRFNHCGYCTFDPVCRLDRKSLKKL